MAKASQLARLAALEERMNPDVLEILNPRTFEIKDPAEREQAERNNAARIAAARKAGKRVITLEPLRSFGE